MSSRAIRILGLDPGLQHTGWGLIETDGYRLRFVAEGVVSTSARDALGDRLLILHQGLAEAFANLQPDEAAVENTYVARNPESALKLGQARGVVMLAPRLAGLPVAEYGAMEVKRAVVGNGHAAKEQVQAMVRHLLPGVAFRRADAADALAIAICHAHHRQTKKMLAGAFSSQAAKLGDSENATKPAFSSQAAKLGDSENATKPAFSSQAAELGDSENATKPAFSSQAAKLGDSENAIKQGPKDVLLRAAAAKRL